MITSSSSSSVFAITYLCGVGSFLLEAKEPLSKHLWAHCRQQPHSVFAVRYLCGIGSFFALKQAVAAARKDAGITGWFEVEAPATPAVAQQACGVKL